ncbi:MAG: hypothetical protein ACMXYL_00725 [Candidatus Woesearchaeota archaeon]
MSWNQFFGDLFLNVLPELLFNVLIGLLIIFLGIALGFLAKKITMGLLKGLKFEKLMEQVKLSHAFGSISVSEVLADILEAVVIIAFLAQGLDQMGLYLLSGALTSLLGWVPMLLAGLLMLAVFYILAKYVESRIQASNLGNADNIAKYTFAAIIVIGAVVSLRQAGLNTAFIEQALLIVVFGFALAFALAVGISMGLGLKGDAKKLVSKTTKPATRKKAKRKKK